MQFLGLTIARTKSLVPVRSWPSLFGYVRESFAGAWQRNVVVDDRESLLSNPYVFACLTRIASDIAKLRIKLVELDGEGIWNEVMAQSPFWPVLRKPNNYQNRIQFISSWVMTKLIFGNAYIWKERDARGIVTTLHVLDPRRVTALVAEDGSVFYQLGNDPLAGIGSVQNTVPASEIIHDRCETLFHPLVGVSPLYGCGGVATQGNRISANSAQFFENMSRPSGVLSAPGVITDETAARIKAYWEENFTASKIGRLAVLGDALKYEAMTIPAADAQLAEQWKITGEVIAGTFHMPGYKIGVGPMPTNNNVEALEQQYYSGCLQILIEALELCLDEGLNLTEVKDKTYGTEFDLDGLLRMDSSTLLATLKVGVDGSILAPDEARKRMNLRSVPGGSSPMAQQQQYSLEALAERDQDKPFAKPTPGPAATPANDEAMPDDEAAADETRELIEHIQKGLECSAQT